MWGFDGFATEEVEFAVCLVIGEDGVEFFNQLEAPVGPVLASGERSEEKKIRRTTVPRWGESKVCRLCSVCALTGSAKIGGKSRNDASKTLAR